MLDGAQIMSIIDSLHSANEELTADFAHDLLVMTAREIDAHKAETWHLARDHAAAMVRSGWDIETAAMSASDKYGVPSRPIRLLILDEMDSFGQQVRA